MATALHREPFGGVQGEQPDRFNQIHRGRTRHRVHSTAESIFLLRAYVNFVDYFTIAVCLSVCLSVLEDLTFGLSVCLSVFPSYINIFLAYLSVCLSVFPSYMNTFLDCPSASVFLFILDH